MSDPKETTGLDYSKVLRAERDAKGRRAHEVFMEWAIDQSDLSPSWTDPYDDLTESAKNAYRLVGSTLWGDGFLRGYVTGLKAAYEMMTEDRRTSGP